MIAVVTVLRVEGLGQRVVAAISCRFSLFLIVVTCYVSLSLSRALSRSLSRSLSIIIAAIPTSMLKMRFCFLCLFVITVMATESPPRPRPRPGNPKP